MSLFQEVVDIIQSVISFDTGTQGLSPQTPLLGAIPEFDSMAVVNIIASLEDRFGFVIEDDEIDASVFETLGALVVFVESKL